MSRRLTWNAPELARMRNIQFWMLKQMKNAGRFILQKAEA